LFIASVWLKIISIGDKDTTASLGPCDIQGDHDMKTIDLRSDTVTHPTDEMRQAMHKAEVGDDVFGEDPTVNRLEELAAQRMGKEAALFTPSGTMSNLLAVLSQTKHGDEIILGSEAHIFWNEVGGAAALGGVVMRTVQNAADGTISIREAETAIRSQNIHYPPTTLLCLENTHNRCGGAALTAEYTAEICGMAHAHGLKVHLDGARIFNAAVALDVPAAVLAAPADSVCFCLSKGLSAPVGSLLCGANDFISRARKLRKMVGGGMRQAGVIAAAGIVAIETMAERLAEDHANARRLGAGLSSINGMKVEPVQTNIVMFEPPEDSEAPAFIKLMHENGVLFTYPGGRRVRAVTHRMISSADIDEALASIKRVILKVV
jgi:threonine aldolase